jgi:5-methylcytosine-specific restriction endonuclease McrA
MPAAAARRCTFPGCSGRPQPGRYRCDTHAAAAARRTDRARGSFRARGYDSSWDRRSHAYLARHPRCVDCGGIAVISDHAPLTRRALVAAGVVDPDADEHLEGRCRACDSRRRVTVEGAFGGGPAR